MSPPDDLIPPQISGDSFAAHLLRIAARPDVQTILEIGSSSGEGSTAALVAGMAANPFSPTLYCVELSRTRFEKLARRYQGNPRVRCYRASSVPLAALASRQEVLDFHAACQTRFIRFPH